MHAPLWEPGNQYNIGDRVRYNDATYKIIQPHFSQSDWTPDETPALWGRLQDCDDSCGDQQCGNQQQQYGQQQHQEKPSQYQDSQTNQGYGENKPATEKQWYGGEETKKKLEIGGGVAAGAALLAGGLFAYKKHEEHKEEEKSKHWAQGNWLEEAKARTEEFHRRGRSGPAVWVLTQGKNIPNGAIPTGNERGNDLYTSRSLHEGSIVVGKASQVFHKGSLIGYGDDEIEVNEYEVLVGDMNQLKWVGVTGRLNIQNLGHRPVEGGHEKNGTPVYIARGPYKEAVHPGKVSEKLEGAYITYGGKEKVLKEYQVLCYK